MKAVVFYGTGDIRVSEDPDPKLQQRTDAIVRLTASAICGTDLHMVRGTMPGMEPGTILGHEGVGIVEELGPNVRNFRVGDRVVIRRRLRVEHVPIVGPDISHNAIRPIPMVRAQGARFSADPKRPGRSTACKQSGRGSRMRMSDW